MAKNDGRTLSDDEKEEFAYELALGYFDDDGLRTKFGLSPKGFELRRDSVEIKRMVVMKQRELDESDDAMKIIARRAARIAIAELATLSSDEDAPAKTRMDAARQLREFATIVDKSAIASGGEGIVYIKTNLDLGGGNGVYAVTAKEIEDEIEDEDDDDFADLLGVS